MDNRGTTPFFGEPKRIGGVNRRWLFYLDVTIVAPYDRSGLDGGMPQA